MVSGRISNSLLVGRSRSQNESRARAILSQDDGRIHFGLGSAIKVDKLTVNWPSGREQVLENLSVDRILTVEEPK